MTDFCRSDGRFSALDALQPIAVLIVALVKMNLVRANHRSRILGSLATNGCGATAALPPGRCP